MEKSGAAVRSVRQSLPVIEAAGQLSAVTAGKAPSLPFPAKGEGAVALLGTGVVAESAHEHPVPVASLTKMMTAYLVLKAHPLVGTEVGPSLTFTEADHLAWIQASSGDQSNVELVKGERLNERQLLEALLIPSANNVANLLGRWVSGSDKAFVALMNKTARSLGLDSTHYADASGFDPKSVSTAADQARLAAIDMENPVFRSIVALPDVAFPVMGHIWNYNPALGVDGIVGVKSGFTAQANGCLVTALYHEVGGHRVLVVAAVTGQPLGLWQAAQEDEALSTAAVRQLRLVSPFGSRRLLARLSAPWRSGRIGLVAAAPLTVAGWGGLSFTSRLVGAPLSPAGLRRGWMAGESLGVLQVFDQYGFAFTVPLELERRLAPPPAGAFGDRSGLAVRTSS
jgi:D-alanyl-D-alanine carboxypeptidase (penicillin-binding protein 5/6)